MKKISLMYNWITVLKKVFGKPKSIQVTSMSKAEWENVISKLDVEFIAVTIDCFSYRKKRKHYIENIPKIIDPQKTLFDMTNYPGYVIIYMSNNDDLSTLCETYNNIYWLYGEVTKIELLSGKFYRDKDSDEPTNEIQFSLKELPISYMDFNQIINSIYI